MISTSCQSSSSISLTSLRIERVGVEQVVGQEQFRLVVDPLEQERHGRVQGVALGDQQQPVKLGLLVPVELQVDHPLPVQARQFDMLGVFEDFRRRLAFGVAQDPVAVVEVAVQFHVPDGDQPVEPCVGQGLHRLLEAVPLDPLLELPSACSATARGTPARRSPPRRPCSTTGSIFVAVSP